jgi:hypothetical protein
MVRRTVFRFLGAVGLVVAGLGPLAPAAEAAPRAPAAAAALTCSSGYACVIDYNGNVLYRNAGNTGSIAVRVPNAGYVWNNGYAYEGADHIQVYMRTPSGSRFTICLHYGPRVDGSNPTIGRLLAGETVTSWRWRGECGANEDVWRPY